MDPDELGILAKTGNAICDVVGVTLCFAPFTAGKDLAGVGRIKQLFL